MVFPPPEKQSTRNIGPCRLRAKGREAVLGDDGSRADTVTDQRKIPRRTGHEGALSLSPGASSSDEHLREDR